MTMRHIMTLCEALMEDWLRHDLYHGTARRRLAFSPTHVAYFTPDLRTAWKLATMDAEVDGGIPRVIRVKLNIRNPARLDTMEMQDLHYKDDLVAKLHAEGYDSAIGEYDNEVAVFGNQHIHIEEIMEKPMLGEASLGDLSHSYGDAIEGIGPQQMDVFRVGPLDNTLPRGIFFGGSEEDAKAYHGLHQNHSVQRYLVTAKNVLIAPNQFKLLAHFTRKKFDGMDFDRIAARMRDAVLANRHVDKLVASKARGAGYDAIIYTHPRPPALVELQVINMKSVKITDATRPEPTATSHQ